jgi:hypothetical protein
LKFSPSDPASSNEEGITVAKATRSVGAAAFTLAMAAASGAVAALPAERGIAPLVICLDDHVGVPAGIWTVAEAEATRIFRNAGVPVEWTHRRDDQQTRCKGSIDFTVVTLTHSGADEKSNDPAELPVAGKAVRGSGRAYVYYHPVKCAAERHTHHVGTVLGMVIAHELGHLLLPPNSHTYVGIMRADLDLTSRRPGEFTQPQAAAIRTYLLPTRLAH